MGQTRDRRLPRASLFSRSSFVPSATRRRLGVESLEQRQLLAADCGESFSAMLAQDELLAPTSLEPIGETVSIQGVNALEAGSTRRSSRDLGVLGDQRSIRGSVSYRDRSDVFRIELDQESTLSVDLDPSRYDADLALYDATGRVIAQSQLYSTATDQVVETLDAGEYFVGVIAAHWRRNRYTLSLTVEASAVPPPAETTPPSQTTPPVGATPPEGEPVVVVDPSVPSTPSPSGDTVSDLADVAYFGSSRDWNVNAVGAPEAWAAGYTGQGVTVAIVDTGVDLDHPDLVHRLYVNPGEIAGNGVDDDGNGYVDDISGYDFANRDANPNDINGHGTHVAGTIAASNNGFGATGIAPDASILPVRVLGDNGSGSTIDVAAGIRYAADLGADIINLSLGGGYSRTIDSAIRYAEALGSFIVAASGNEASAVPGYPARFSSQYSNVLSVGASNSSGRIAGFSNSVGGSGAVQIDAPGVGIYSTYTGGRYGSLSGTSMATPHVAGVAALALSANPALTPSQLRDLLTGAATTRASNSDSLGQLSAATTVAYAAAGRTAVTNSSGGGSSNASNSSSIARASRATSVDGGVLLVQSTSTSNLAFLGSQFDLAGLTIVSHHNKVIGSSVVSSPSARDAYFTDDSSSESVHEQDNADAIDEFVALLVS